MVDLDVLAMFLASDRAPEGGMDLSEFDGFMAGVAAGPAPMDPAEWLAVAWDDEEPDFADADEEAAVMGAIAARFEEIAAGLDGDGPAYAPVFWEDPTGAAVAEDWCAGFMQAVQMLSGAWKAALADEAASGLLIPIAALAGLAMPPEWGGDLPVPDDALDSWVADPEAVLPGCAAGLRAFWRSAGVARGAFPPALRH
jgi:uncharacterized protein